MIVVVFVCLSIKGNKIEIGISHQIIEAVAVEVIHIQAQALPPQAPRPSAGPVHSAPTPSCQPP
jgi:hypothetical protein